MAYHEEAQIRECILSAKPVVSEIILVHDGECKDRTIRIAQSLGAKTYIRPRIGEAEPHREYALSKASKKWVLVLDSDERITMPLQKLIPTLVTSERISGYRFKWLFYDKGKQITKGSLSQSKKLILFKKKLAIAPKKFHEWYKVKGLIINSEFEIDHKQPHNNWGWGNFFKKSGTWAVLDAKHRIKNGYADQKWGIYIFKAFIWYFAIIVLKLFKEKLIKEGELGRRIAFQHATYNLILYLSIADMKLNNNEND